MLPTRLLLRLLALLCLGISLHLQASPAELCEADFPGLSEALKLEKEASWALARDAYAKALENLPPGRAHDWCAFLLFNATQLAAPAPGDWQARQTWDREQDAGYRQLLKPYENGARSKDALWATLEEAHIQFLATRSWLNPGDLQGRRIALIEFHGSKPNTKTNAKAWYDSLQRLYPSNNSFTSSWNNQVEEPKYADQRRQLIHQFRKASECTLLEHRQRDWSRCMAVLLEDPLIKQLPARHALLQAALEACVTPAYQTLLNAELFFNEAASLQQAGPKATAPDYPALLRQAKTLRDELKPHLTEPLLQLQDDALARFVDTWSTPILNAYLEKVPLPGEPLVLEYGQFGYKGLEWELHTLNEKDWSTLKRVNVDSKPSFKKQLGSRRPAWSGHLNFEAPEKLLWKHEKVRLQEALPPGLYCLLLEGKGSGKGTYKCMTFVVTKTRGTLLYTDKHQGSLYFCDKTSGMPKAKSEVKLYFSEVSGGQATLQAKTDQSGHLAVPLPAAKGDSYRRGLVAWIQGQPVELDWYNYTRNDRRQDVAMDLFVERPLFRPGETVHWRLFLRERTDTQWTIPKDKLRMIVGDTKGNVLLDLKNLHLDARGSLMGELALTPAQKPANLLLVLTTDQAAAADEINRYRALASSELCTVDNFVPPPIEAALQLDNPKALIPGGHVRLQARVNYFSGGPVPGAKAHLNLGLVPLDYRAYEAHGKEIEKWNQSMRETPLLALSGPDGLASFELTLPDFPDLPLQLTASVQVNPEGVAPLTLNKSWPLIPEGLVCQTSQAGVSALQPGETGLFKAQVLDVEDKPFEGDLDLLLAKRAWHEVWLDPEGKTHAVRPENFPIPEPDAQGRRRWQDWELLSHGYRDQLVSNTEVRTDAEGRLCHTLDIPEEGLWVVWLARNGTPLWQAKQSTASAALHYKGLPNPLLVLVCAGESTKSLPLAPDSLVCAPSQEKSADNRIRALCVSTHPTSDTLLCLTSERSMNSALLEPSRQVQWGEIAKPDTQSGALTLILFAGIVATQTQLEGMPQSPALQVSLNPSEKAWQPGKTTALQLHLKDTVGNARTGRVALSITDESLNTLLGTTGDDSPLFEKPFPALQVIRAGSEDPAYGGGYGGAPFTDPRVGGLDDELIFLSPFSVSEGNSFGAYAANATLAGTRLRTELREVASSITVVNAQFLSDTGATTTGELLQYTTATELAAPRIRRHFASTALWAPDLKVSGKEGEKVSFTLPDNLTRWVLRAYAVSEDGAHFASTRLTREASLPLQARLNAPRFLVAGDSLELDSALVNRSDSAVPAKVSLLVEGSGALQTADASKTLSLPASGEQHQVWPLKANAQGEVSLQLTLQAKEHADAAVQKLPVLEDGAQLPFAAPSILGDKQGSTEIRFDLPSSPDAKRTTLSLNLSSALETQLVEALPYLVDYPYGCVEQTMSRFMPGILVSQLLEERGLEPEAIEAHILSRIGAQRKQEAPLAKLDDILLASLQRLEAAQREDGSFGWWPGSPYADLWMSSYVKWGLTQCHDKLLDLEGEDEKAADAMEEKLTDWLEQTLTNEQKREPNCEAWALAALCFDSDLTTSTKESLKPVFARLFEARATLNTRGRACLALAAPALAKREQQATLLRNLSNDAVLSDKPGFGRLAQWGVGAGFWLADEGAVENTAMTLLALLANEPTHPLVQPATDWLLLNRQSANWYNTRDTAFALMALARKLKLQTNDSEDIQLALSLNGKPWKQLTLGSQEILTGGVNLPLDPASLLPGTNHITLTRLSGEGRIDALLAGSVWRPGSEIEAASSLVSLHRGCVALRSEQTLAGESIPVPVRVLDQQTVTRGSQLYLELALDIPHDLEYLMLQVPKAASMEPLNPLSAWDVTLFPLSKEEHDAQVAGTSQPAAILPEPGRWTRLLYREEHDARSCIFINSLSSGLWRLRIPVTAVHAGDFRLLPASLEAMYAPSIKANSKAARLRVTH